MPRFETKDEFFKPPGLSGTLGRVPVCLPADDEAVAIAVGNTNDGSELPAKLRLINPQCHVHTPSWCTLCHCLWSQFQKFNTRTAQSHWTATCWLRSGGKVKCRGGYARRGWCTGRP